jgi:hypothetical protein
MSSFRTSIRTAATATLAALLVGATASSDLGSESAALELAKPWSLGDPETAALPLDERGMSQVAWDAGKPIGLESRHALARGVSLHIGGEVLPLRGADAVGRPVSGDDSDWQVGAGLRARLDERWSVGVGASWRSGSTDGLPILTPLRSRSSVGSGDGEGVVWLRLSASF